MKKILFLSLMIINTFLYANVNTIDVINVYGISKRFVQFKSDTIIIDNDSLSNFTERKGDFVMNMIAIKNGFIMLSCISDLVECNDKFGGCTNNVTEHLLRIKVGNFCMSETEVTQQQWRAVMGTNPNKLYNTGCDECPVEGVSSYDIQVFINKLNKLTGKNSFLEYRLPTEVEWEYAARGGESYMYPGSNNLDDVAWYNGNSQNSKHGSQGTTHPVKTKKANGYGLYDMSGNVWEWCSDSYNIYFPCSKNYSEIADKIQIIRGGSWFENTSFIKGYSRSFFNKKTQDEAIGFRLVLSTSPPSNYRTSK
jgi:formylglycine-generating enzyme required for sulfatase activity